MTRPNWQRLQAELAELKPAAQPRPADAFWAEFRQRAATAPREQPLPSLLVVPRWALATAAALVLAGLVGLAVWERPAPMAPPLAPTVATMHLAGNRILSLTVMAPNDGYIIINDDPAAGTILLISGGDNEEESP